MTPLVNFAANITPAQGVLNSFWGAIVVPELAGSYGVPNGAIPTNVNYNGTGVPIPGPIFRTITEYSYVIEVGTGVTAGHVGIWALRLDGNWHAAGISNLAPVASTNYYGSVATAAIGSLTNLYGTPLLGVAMVILQFALAGGNYNYLEIAAVSELIDPHMKPLVMQAGLKL